MKTQVLSNDYTACNATTDREALLEQGGRYAELYAGQFAGS